MTFDETAWIEPSDADRTEHDAPPEFSDVDLDGDGYDERDDPASSPVPEPPAAEPTRDGVLLPIAQATIPAWVATFGNGRLPLDRMIKVAPLGSGYLIPEAAGRWRSLQNAAQAAGYNLTMTGAFRTYEQQLAMFQQRYVATNIGASSKVWNGQRYWLRPGNAMAAVPGTSNHGWGAAVDLALTGYGSAARSVTEDPGFMSWVIENAADHGWSWETQSEVWHLRIVALPPRVTSGYRAPTPTLKYGDRGGQVAALQNLCLSHTWGDCGHADGEFGRRTEAAVSALQVAVGSAADGRYGPNTARALATFLSSAPTGAPPVGGAAAGLGSAPTVSDRVGNER